MYKTGKKSTVSQWNAVQNELSVRTMHAMSGYAKEGINSKIIIGSKEQLPSMVRDLDVQQGAFTAWGKLSEERIGRLLKTLAEKYEVHLEISCMRRIR